MLFLRNCKNFLIRREFNRTLLRLSPLLYSSTDCNIPPKDEAKPHRRRLLDGPNLKDFFKTEHLQNVDHLDENEIIPYLKSSVTLGKARKVYFEIYGCQMNQNDTEIIWSILKSVGYIKTNNLKHADVILIITCSIREGAEQKIWNRLDYIKGLTKKIQKDVKIGILGCMAERLKHRVLEIDKSVDLVAGPDSYKDLPRLLALAEDNEVAINVMLSWDETYADVMPVRLNADSKTAFVSIMRGCENMCTYCIVPFTRGKERSRPTQSIIDEIKHLRDAGIKEITLLGQNVNSYRDLSEDVNHGTPTNMAKGFKTVYKLKESGLRFADLLHQVASVDPEIRIRFTSPHPKDFPDEVLEAIRSSPNICKSLHLPAQSGNSQVLERMRRGYTREAYVELVDHVRAVIPDVALSSDFIAGFCGETEEEFEDTLSLIHYVKFSNAYLFQYSMREKTTAHRRLEDNVPLAVKLDRLTRMVHAYRTEVAALNQAQIGASHLVLIEGRSKRSENFLAGRNDHNVKVIIPAGEVGDATDGNLAPIRPGDYIAVQINASTSQVLKGIPLYRTTLSDYHAAKASPYEYHVHMQNT
ncbi:mitochondrial tRNA methylthiotransferase CDK5RAP1 [Atheta coriaria]|uniref:mitochondrial tRNA methylthiotransferase CDK5RAP1 n=1 Tax=Dalotia coriaria TaxID=877792 RepID=UPI0031F4785D